MGSWRDWVKLLPENRPQVLTTAPPVTAKLQLVVKATQRFESVAMRKRTLLRQVTQRAEVRQVLQSRPAQANWARLEPAPAA
jgi:hypothetical protein